MAKKNRGKSNFFDYAIMALFFVVITAVIMMIFYSNNYINRYVDMIQENIAKRLLTEGVAIQSLTSAAELQSFMNNRNTECEAYTTLRKELNFYAVGQDLSYIYFMRLHSGKVEYIIDSRLDKETQRNIGYTVEAYALIWEATGSKQPVISIIGENSTGHTGYLSAHFPIFDEYGKLIAVLGIDIPEREIIQRKEEVNRLGYISVFSIVFLGFMSFVVVVGYRKKAFDFYRASVAKTEFLSKMSHEMRTPMNGIIGFCRMAKNATDIQKKDEHLNSIAASSDYLLELINGILDISTIEANKMGLDKETASINEMVEEIKRIINPQIITKQQNFKVEISNEIPKYLHFDQIRLAQVLINLISNALKFTPEQGTVTLRVSVLRKLETAYNIEFIVQDTGIGIEPKKLKNLFNPFEQADSSITRKYGGTGLGLTISKHLVQLMKGNITVSSKENEGSTFRFDVWLDIPTAEQLIEVQTNPATPITPVTAQEPQIPAEPLTPAPPPIAQEQPPPAAVPAAPDPKSTLCQGMYFLVAEDNNINQIIVKDLLEEFGATVEFAADGNEAVQMFTENPEKYKFIFMDIQMPNKDGVEAAIEIRKSKAPNAKTIPIFAVTAEAFQEDIDRATEAGINKHIPKPIDVKVVENIIKEFLDK